MKKTAGGVTAAKGFMAGSAQAGIKYENRTDMALVYSVTPAVMAATFTTNLVKAAPVRWDMQLLQEKQPVQAVVVNSGIANACTGEEGDRANLAMAEAVAEALQIPVKSVMTASTGIIGRQLPVDRVKMGAPKLASALNASLESGTAAAKAIMTTDTIEKECAVQICVGGKKAIIGGMSKGSGMIHPNMATMLGIVTTDAAISQKLLQQAVSDIVKVTFNMISVDRDTSTNDTLAVLANGQAGNQEIKEAGADYEEFYLGLLTVLTSLAKKMAGDGEGATKLIECRIQHAKNQEQAVLLAKSVITSNLTKAMVFGNDANWGRIICALGYSGAEFDPEKVDITIQGQEKEDGELVSGAPLMLAKDGTDAGYSEETATKIISAGIVTVTADVKCGDAEATAWGCDLTFDYIKINADYRS